MNAEKLPGYPNLAECRGCDKLVVKREHGVRLYQCKERKATFDPFEQNVFAQECWRKQARILRGNR